MRTNARQFVPAALLVLAVASAAQAAPAFTVAFNDPGSAHSAYYSDIQSNLLAAANTWADVLPGSGTIDIMVDFTNQPTLSASSAASQYVHTTGGISVYEMGAIYERQTGIDPNGATPDVYLHIGTSFLANSLWFDPHPVNRFETVPANQVDAVSAFLHELGHAWAFSGWRDPSTGALATSYESTFDEHVINVGGVLYFTGANADAFYGGDVPLTAGNFMHFGNSVASGLPGSDLLTDLMNGVNFLDSTRYYISPLDLAALQDMGITIGAPGGDVPPSAVPEPASLAFLAAGALVLLARRRRA